MRNAAEALTLANASRLSMLSPGSCAFLMTAVSTWGEGGGRGGGMEGR